MIDAPVAEVSRHKCLVYDGDPSEQLPVIVPLLIDGLQTRRRCLYLGPPEMISMVDSALCARGIDTAEEARRGALLFSSDRSHLDHGFDPKALVDMLCQLIDEAVRDGYEGLCATGDMRWELGADENFERLLEYEALLEKVFREKPLQGICQYHRRTVPARAVRDALLTHRSAYFGAELNRENLFYIPPELLLANVDPSVRDRQGEWMSQQITRVLRAESLRDQAQARLEEVNRDLERRVRERTADLEAANRELEAFSYSVSHDLRAPLRTIEGFSGVLLEDFASPLGEDGRRHLDKVCDGVRRMRELIDGMLSLAHLAKAEMNRQPLDLGAMAGEIVRELRQAEPTRAVEVAIGKDLKAHGDRPLVRSALENLLGNAWKFTSKVAAARIEFGKAREHFFVRDNGAGFDPQQASKLFGVFQRLHTQADFKGNGIGLATVQRVIRRHGGRIWAEGIPGLGATFYFTLPE